LEAVAIKQPNDTQLTLNNHLGLLIITNSTQAAEAAFSSLASWHLSDAKYMDSEALMTDPEQYPETLSISVMMLLDL
jgi:hypothetical protein